MRTQKVWITSPLLPGGSLSPLEEEYCIKVKTNMLSLTQQPFIFTSDVVSYLYHWLECMAFACLQDQKNGYIYTHIYIYIYLILISNSTKNGWDMKKNWNSCFLFFFENLNYFTLQKNIFLRFLSIQQISSEYCHSFW